MDDLIDRSAVLPILAGLARTQMEYDESYDKLMQIPQANRWISVEDALPEVWKEVLVVLNINGYQSICIGEIQEGGEWMVNGEFWYDKGDPAITHWMPLPEIPEPPEKE